MAAPRGLSSVFAFALLLAAASATSPYVREAFSYSGAKGPSNWGQLSSDSSACSDGKNQSPINVVKNQTVLNRSLEPLTRDYRPGNATLVNNGFSVGIIYEQDVGVLMVAGKNYSLRQMHWHTPSEHRIDRVQYPAEIQLFHQAEDGSLAIAAILYDYGKPDPFLGKIEYELAELGKETCGEDEESHIPLGIFNPKNIKRNTRKYYRYIGSTTTPPCTEPVVWNILGKVRTISKEQVEALRAPLYSDCKDNSRPLQSLNGRQIQLYDEFSHA